MGLLTRGGWKGKALGLGIQYGVRMNKKVGGKPFASPY